MQADHHVKQAVLAAQEQFWRGLQTKDRALLTAVISAQFVGRSPGEPDQTRDEFLARLLAFPLAISDIEGEDLAIHTFGAVAVLTGVQVARVDLPDGAARRSWVMLSTVFGQEAGRWLMLLSYAVELVEDI